MSDAENPGRGPLDKALVDAAFVCDFVKVRELLAAGADVNARDVDGRTPIFSAVLGGSVGLLGLLLEAGADVNARDGDGWTALHFAAQEHLPAMAKVLIGRGADVNAQDDDGCSVLWRAVQAARADNELVLLLVGHGAKPDLVNLQGENARDLAERTANPVFSSN